jgi:hypothetical protein
MLSLAVSNTSAAVAWAAYDAAMIELQEMYRDPARAGDAPVLRAARLRQAEQAAGHWNAWRDLFLRNGGGQ